MAMLRELAEINLIVGRALRKQVEATGEAGDNAAEVLHEVDRGVRRAVGLRQKLYNDSRKTPEERHAERLRRIEVEARATVRARRNFVQRAVEAEIRADAEARGAPEEAALLIKYLPERLVDVDIARADTAEAVWAIILGLCKDAGITPRNDIWSHTLLKHGISTAKTELDRLVASFQPPEAAMTPPPPQPPKPPQVYPKIGPFTFGPTGAIVKTDVEPPDWAKPYALRPEGAKPVPAPDPTAAQPAAAPAPASVAADPDKREWADLIAHGRPLPDFIKGRGPPKGG